MIASPRTRAVLLKLATALILWPTLPSAALAQDSRFVSVIPDLPLMDGISENTQEAVVFETATGRIAEAVGTGRIDAVSVEKFYAETLPQLGWRVLPDGKYAREGEALSLEILADDPAEGQITLRLRLTPAE